MTTMAEPEWDTESRVAALGLLRMDRCSVCGGPAELCQDPNRQEDWLAGDPVRCHATTVRLQKQRGFSEDTNPQLAALTWPVYLTSRQGGVR